MTNLNVPVRFFAYGCSEEVDIFEIVEEQFQVLVNEDGFRISYERHTVYQNGCSQICLTVQNQNEPLEFSND